MTSLDKQLEDLISERNAFEAELLLSRELIKQLESVIKLQQEH